MGCGKGRAAMRPVKHQRVFRIFVGITEAELGKAGALGIEALRGFSGRDRPKEVGSCLDIGEGRCGGVNRGER